MPAGGGYAVTTGAGDALASAVRMDAMPPHILAEKARPSYCSGATYLVFLKTLVHLQNQGSISLDEAGWKALLPARMPDGESVWGRWNANGPGTSRLFHELGLGKNFTNYADAKPGDFMKIFWTDAVGRNERGHSVVFLGLSKAGEVETVRFWSSNKPGGFGEKEVPKSKIARVIFSRLESPARIADVAKLPKKDSYLASLLRKESSFAEAKKMVGAE